MLMEKEERFKEQEAEAWSVVPIKVVSMPLMLIWTHIRTQRQNSLVKP